MRGGTAKPAAALAQSANAANCHWPARGGLRFDRRVVVPMLAHLGNVADGHRRLGVQSGKGVQSFAQQGFLETIAGTPEQFTTTLSQAQTTSARTFIGIGFATTIEEAGMAVGMPPF